MTNIPGLPGGELLKMVISAFKDAEVSPNKLLGVFTVQFNPNQYTRRYAHRVIPEGSAGGTERQGKSMGQIQEEMSFEFLFDGTGVVPAGLSLNVTPSPQSLAKQLVSQSGILGVVEGQVQQFLDLTYHPNNESHEAPYLILSWGTLQFTCKLKSADVSYSLFDTFGRPLRAKVNATFVKNQPPKLALAELNLRSPDLTRFHEVSEDDRLYNLAEKVYEKPSYYLQLAKVNGLNHFRRLRTGSQLRMPPVRNSAENTSDL